MPVISSSARAAYSSLDEMIDRGTHSIVIGSVEAVRTCDAGQALIYWRGGYRPLNA
jgi:flavin reductase (DIM6/NTAB) family NADH-FMN oxidoreductase RutF